jgi:hypothetical protein
VEWKRLGKDGNKPNMHRFSDAHLFATWLDAQKTCGQLKQIDTHLFHEN